MKITLVGGGSLGWGPRVVGELLSNAYLEGSRVTLYDLDEEALERVFRRAGRYGEELGTATTVERTIDRSEALDGADFVVVTISTRSSPAPGPLFIAPIIACSARAAVYTCPTRGSNGVRWNESTRPLHGRRRSPWFPAHARMHPARATGPGLGARRPSGSPRSPATRPSRRPTWLASRPSRSPDARPRSQWPTRRPAGRRPRPVGISGATVTKQLIRRGIAAVGFSAGDADMAHVANENIAIDEVMTFAKVIVMVAVRLLGIKE